MRCIHILFSGNNLRERGGNELKILVIGSLERTKGGSIKGGAEKSMIMMANYFAKIGHDVMLSSISGDERPYEISADVQVKLYSINSDNKLVVHYEMRKNTIDIIRKFRPDVMISFWIQPAFYGSRTVKRMKGKSIYTLRNDPERGYGVITKIMRKLTLRQVDGVVFQTKGAQLYFDEKIRKKSVIIHNPIYFQPSAIQVPKERQKKIVTVGRLSEQKNQKELINVFAKVVKEYPDFVLEIYGEGELRTILQHQIDSHNLSNKVYLKGAVENVIEHIKDASIFVLSSIYEGMPNALMEAMAAGVPVISSDCSPGGPRELIEHNEDGLLYKVGDEKALCECMKQIINNTEHSEIMAQKAKNKMLLHTEDIIFREWEKFIMDIINN